MRRLRTVIGRKEVRPLRDLPAFTAARTIILPLCQPQTGISSPAYPAFPLPHFYTANDAPFAIRAEEGPALS
jgi:hypothetical protein